MVLVAHSESDGLSDNDLYHSSLEEVSQGQSHLKRLLDHKRFLSLGFLYNPDKLYFRREQQRSMASWLREEPVP